MILWRRLVLMLGLLFLTACTGTPKASGPAELYFQTGSGVLRLHPVGGWQPSAASHGRAWHNRQARLEIFTIPRVSPMLAAGVQALQEAEGLALKKPQRARDRLDRLYDNLKRIQRFEADSRLLESAWYDLKANRCKPALPKLAAVRQHLQADLDQTDLFPVLKSRFDTPDFHRYPQDAGQPLSLAGRLPAALFSISTGGAFGHGLYFLKGEELVAVEYFTSPKERAGGAEVLRQMGSTLEFDVPSPAPDLLAEPTPEPRPTARQTRSHRVRERGWLERTLVRSLPWLVFLAFTALPAYLGASSGYLAAQMAGGNHRSAAAQGAGSATFFGFGMGVVAACVLLLAFTFGLPAGSGIMSPFAGGVLISMVLAVLGVIGATAAALAAGLGAYVGAGISRGAAARLAALGAMAGAMLGPLAMGWFPH